ncbi:MAG: flavodoxin family protein [Bacillota bacterium]
MKVVAFNGSPNTNGNTYQAISLVSEELKNKNIEVEIIQVGNKVIRGCMGCNQCFKNQNNQCVFSDDQVNEWIEKINNADGIILASPVHYAGISGTMKSFLDRAFYTIGANGNSLKHKVGISLAAVRRSGGIPAVNQLNKYLEYSELIIPTSNYWNVIHGAKPGEIHEDKEGVQIMKTLGKKMAWALNLKEESNIETPEDIEKVYTNFIR